MIKRRLGEDFATKISANIELKAAEVAKRGDKGGKRKPRENRGEKGERKETSRLGWCVYEKKKIFD